jgi:hypothetical protein
MQQLQRDVLTAFALAVHLEPVGLRSSRSEFLFRPREQLCLEGSVVQVVGQWPTQPGPLCAFEVALNRRRTDADALRDLPVAELLRTEPQDLGDLAHG